MSETPKPVGIFTDFEQANVYVEQALEHYRNEDAAFKGSRNNEELQLISAVTSDEARAIIDGTMLGIMGMSNLVVGVNPTDVIENPPTENDREPLIGGRSWSELRDAYVHSMVDFAILTHRLHHKGFDIPDFSDMTESDRIKAASVILGNMLHINAYRFGIETVDNTVNTHKTRHTDDGGIEHYVHSVDKDKAYTPRDLSNNVRQRGFRLEGSAHPAIKITPAEYARLRKEFPLDDMEKFDRDVSYHTNARQVFEDRE